MEKMWEYLQTKKWKDKVSKPGHVYKIFVLKKTVN